MKDKFQIRNPQTNKIKYFEIWNKGKTIIIKELKGGNQDGNKTRKD